MLYLFAYITLVSYIIVITCDYDELNVYLTELRYTRRHDLLIPMLFNPIFISLKKL